MLKGTDVFVIGGGPAGLAAALAARRRGLDVTVADSCAPPIDKPCGEGLMPDSIAALQQLGVSVPATEGQRFRGIRFVSSGLAVEAAFPYGSAMGIRRTNLHQIMADHAEAAGVRLLWNSVVKGICAEGVLLKDEVAPAHWIVGADGGGSRVRRWAGLDVHRRKDQRYAFRRHYSVAPWSEFMELHWASGCQLYITPISGEEVCVALISRNPKLRLDEALHAFPAAAAKLAGREFRSVERGAVSVTRRLARVCRDNVALLGDSSGGVDAITGEGLCLAFRQADLLAECMASGTLEGYEARHRTLMRRPVLMARLMLLLEQRDGLRARVMRAFAANPRLFTHMLATHVGATSPLGAAVHGLALGWKLLRA